jgi:hypothetical protein
MVLPYLKGSVYIFCSLYYGEFFRLFLMIFRYILIFIFIYIQVLNNWYQSTFLSQRREEIFALFCRNFIRKKNRVAHLRFIYEDL